MELFNTNQIQSFIKWSLLELSTNIKIDHRNYCQSDKKKSSLLIEKIKNNNNNFDLGINELSEEIFINEKLINICIELENYKKMSDNKDKKELIEESETELFNEIIELIGLYEISSLHADYFDKFQKKFYEIVYNK